MTQAYEIGNLRAGPPKSFMAYPRAQKSSSLGLWKIPVGVWGKLRAIAGGISSRRSQQNFSIRLQANL